MRHIALLQKSEHTDNRSGGHARHSVHTQLAIYTVREALCQHVAPGMAAAGVYTHSICDKHTCVSEYIMHFCALLL